MNCAAVEHERGLLRSRHHFLLRFYHLISTTPVWPSSMVMLWVSVPRNLFSTRIVCVPGVREIGVVASRPTGLPSTLGEYPPSWVCNKETHHPGLRRGWRRGAKSQRQPPARNRRHHLRHPGAGVVTLVRAKVRVVRTVRAVCERYAAWGYRRYEQQRGCPAVFVVRPASWLRGGPWDQEVRRRGCRDHGAQRRARPATATSGYGSLRVAMVARCWPSVNGCGWKPGHGERGKRARAQFFVGRGAASSRPDPMILNVERMGPWPLSFRSPVPTARPAQRKVLDAEERGRCLRAGEEVIGPTQKRVTQSPATWFPRHPTPAARD